MYTHNLLIKETFLVFGNYLNAGKLKPNDRKNENSLEKEPRPYACLAAFLAIVFHILKQVNTIFKIMFFCIIWQ